MKINIRSLTPATLTINSLGNYIVRGREEAQNVEVNDEQKLELLVLEREGLIKISYLDPANAPQAPQAPQDAPQAPQDAPQDAPKSPSKPKKGRGRPKGAKNKATLDKEEKEKEKEKAKEESEAKEEQKIQAEDDKITRNKTEAEAVTDQMGSRVIVTVPGGAVEGKMVNSVIAEAKESMRADASIKAMEDLEAEEAGEDVEKKQVINEEDLDPSERMGGKAIISDGGDAKEVGLVNSILPEANVIKKRDPFIDRKDNEAVEEIKQDNDDAFLNSLTKEANKQDKQDKKDNEEDNEEDDDTFIEV